MADCVQCIEHEDRIRDLLMSIRGLEANLRNVNNILDKEVAKNNPITKSQSDELVGRVPPEQGRYFRAYLEVAGHVIGKIRSGLGEYLSDSPARSKLSALHEVIWDLERVCERAAYRGEQSD